MGSLCFGQLKSRSSTFGPVHSMMAATFEEKLASAVENLPVLYYKTLKEFKDKKKKNAWQQVAQQLGLESGDIDTT